MTAYLSGRPLTTHEVNKLIAENSKLAAELTHVTAELKEVTRQRDALQPGEGRVVVELPEPVGAYGWDWSSPQGCVEAFHHGGVPRVSIGHIGDWSADEAERTFLAGLAAVRRSRELANEYNSAMSYGGPSV